MDKEEKNWLQKAKEALERYLISEEDDEEPSPILTEKERKAISPYEREKLKLQIPEDAAIILFDPRNFDEAEKIGELIRAKKACLVNLHKIPMAYRQRIIDFLSGVVFGVNGSINLIGEGVFLCSPKELPVTGDIHADTR